MSALGTEFKFGIRVTPIDEMHFDTFDFEVTAYVFENKSVTFKKSDRVHIQKIDQDSYKVVVDAENAMKIGRGRVMAKVEVYIPDADFEDGFRTEVYDKLWTGVTIT